MIDHRASRFTLLLSSQRTVTAVASATFSDCNRLSATLLVSLVPLSQVGGVNADNFTDLFVAPSRFSKPEGRIAKLLQHPRFNLAWINFCRK